MLLLFRGNKKKQKQKKRLLEQLGCELKVLKVPMFWCAVLWKCNFQWQACEEGRGIPRKDCRHRREAGAVDYHCFESGFCGFGGILKNLEPTTEWIGKSAWETS